LINTGPKAAKFKGSLLSAGDIKLTPNQILEHADSRSGEAISRVTFTGFQPSFPAVVRPLSVCIPVSLPTASVDHAK